MPRSYSRTEKDVEDGARQCVPDDYNHRFYITDLAFMPLLLAFRCSSVRSFPPEGDRKGVVEGTNVVPEALWDEKAFSGVHNALAEWSFFKEGKTLGVRLLHCQEAPTRPSAVRQRMLLTGQDSRLERGRGCT